MKNIFGNNITVTLFGESHGDYIGAVLDGLAPGMKIDEEYIESKLAMSISLPFTYGKLKATASWYQPQRPER